MMCLIIVMLVMVGLTLSPTIPIAAEIYRWIDKNGNVFFSDSPPPYGSFKKQNIGDQIDKSIDQRKELEKQSDIDEKDKLDQKIKLEIEYQKKAKAIKDYDAMREELETLREKYQKKDDQLRERWKSSFGWPSTQRDITEERRKLGREYENEAKRIKNLYGYY